MRLEESKRRWWFVLLASVLLLAACQPVSGEPPLTVTLTKADDQAVVRWHAPNLVVDINSPSGIGGLGLTWQGSLRGEALLLRLHLKGLESLQVTNGAQTASLSVASTPPYSVRSEGDAQEIAVQREEGVFTISIPADWLQAGRLDVQWVDYYR